MNILVTGGAGYVGSHTNKLLNKMGYDTIIYDNLVYGHQDFVKWGEFIHGDLSDLNLLRLVFKKHNIVAVMHFAAFAYIGESVEDPEKYYINNISNTLNLLKVMREYNCKYFIFSSTCATYGIPQYLPIDENHPQIPINPYGQSKLIVERILQDYSTVYDFKYVSLRYFNAAGADNECEIGEDHTPETHLIPLVLDVAIGKKEFVKVFGADYDTKDGSAVRDYIHVEDLAQAHMLALKYLMDGNHSDVFNLSNGDGYSVLEVIERAKHITDKEINVIIENRRAGDPSKLIGDSKKAKKILGWNPIFFELDTIIQSAWKWHKLKGKLSRKCKK